MPRQLWIADVLADEFRGSKGFRVDAVPGWERRGREEFWPEGVMQHHTGRGAYNALLAYMTMGSRIAPLSQIATERPVGSTMRITVMAAGRANHAGVGELPWRRGQGSTGNARTFGVENMNAGNQTWPPMQLEAMTRVAYCLLAYMKQNHSRLTDHAVYAPGRKVDRYQHAGVLRVERETIRVWQTQGRPRPTPPAPTPTPPPSPPKPKTTWEVLSEMLTPKELKFAEEFFRYAAANVVHGASIPRQFLAFNREERPVVNQLLASMESMSTNPATLGAALVALVREARARGWLVDPNAFQENAHYRFTDEGVLESAPSADGPWSPVLTTPPAENTGDGDQNE